MFWADTVAEMAANLRLIPFRTNNRTDSGTVCLGYGGRPACRGARPARHPADDPMVPSRETSGCIPRGRGIRRAGRPRYPRHALLLCRASVILFPKYGMKPQGAAREVYFCLLRAVVGIRGEVARMQICSWRKCADASSCGHVSPSRRRCSLRRISRRLSV